MRGSPFRFWLFPGTFGVALVSLAIQLDLRAAGDPVTFHDFNRLPWVELAPGITIKTVVGRAATFVVAEFEPGAATVAHHHTHEQANYGVSGDVAITIAGTPRPLGPDHATMALPDTEHFIRNSGSTRARLLEMQPVRRVDLLPPRPALTFPKRPDAQPIPPAAQSQPTSAAPRRHGRSTAPSARRRSTVTACSFACGMFGLASRMR